MRKIPLKLRAEMQADPFYQVCCYTGRKAPKIEWHHNLIFAGRQINEKFAILPLIPEIHARANEPEVKRRLNWIMLNRATWRERDKFSKVLRLESLRGIYNKKFGEWSPKWYDKTT